MQLPNIVGNQVGTGTVTLHAPHPSTGTITVGTSHRVRTGLESSKYGFAGL